MTDDDRDLTSVLTQPSEDSNVIKVDFITLADIPANDLLDMAKAQALDVVFVLGRYADGTPYAAASSADVGMALVLFEEFKREVI